MIDARAFPGVGWEEMEPGEPGWWIHPPSRVGVEVDRNNIGHVYGPVQRSRPSFFDLRTQTRDFLTEIDRRIHGRGGRPLGAESPSELPAPPSALPPRSAWVEGLIIAGLAGMGLAGFVLGRHVFKGR